MNQFTMQDLKRLAAVKSPMCISMYMPTSPDVSTVDEQRIRFKNLPENNSPVAAILRY